MPVRIIQPRVAGGSSPRMWASEHSCDALIPQGRERLLWGPATSAKDVGAFGEQDREKFGGVGVLTSSILPELCPPLSILRLAKMLSRLVVELLILPACMAVLDGPVGRRLCSFVAFDSPQGHQPLPRPRWTGAAGDLWPPARGRAANS